MKKLLLSMSIFVSTFGFAQGSLDELMGRRLELVEISNVVDVIYEHRIEKFLGQDLAFDSKFGGNCTREELKQRGVVSGKVQHLGGQDITILLSPDECSSSFEYTRFNALSIIPDEGNKATIRFALMNGTIRGLFNPQLVDAEILSRASAEALCSIRVVYAEPSVIGFGQYLVTNQLREKERLLDCNIIKNGSGRVIFKILEPGEKIERR